MRGVLYLGTRSCPSALEEALRGHDDSLLLLVPADPKLLGSHAAEAVQEGYLEVATLLRDRALKRAARIAQRTQKPLADVFGQDPPDPRDRIQARILEGDLQEAAASALRAREVETVYAGRDALDVLDGATSSLEAAPGFADVDLVTV